MAELHTQQKKPTSTMEHHPAAPDVPAPEIEQAATDVGQSAAPHVPPLTHPTARGLRQANVLRMQHSLGNAGVQRVIAKSDATTAERFKDLSSHQLSDEQSAHSHNWQHNGVTLDQDLPEGRHTEHADAEVFRVLDDGATQAVQRKQAREEPAAEEPGNPNREAGVREARHAFARKTEQIFGLEDGAVERQDRSAIGLPPAGEAKERSTNALSKIAGATNQLHAGARARARTGPQTPEARPELVREPRDAVAPEQQPAAVAAEVAAARAPIEQAVLPVDEVSKPGPESSAALNRLQSVPDINPGLVTLGATVQERIAGLREHVAGNAARTSAQLHGEATTQRAAIRGAIGASQQAVSDVMGGTRVRVASSKATAHDTLSQRGAGAHARNTEITQTQTARLQENIDSSVAEAQTVFSEADAEVRTTGESEARRGRNHAHDLARRARELGRTEAERHRRSEEDQDLGEDKADAVLDVANRFADRLATDGDNLASDVHEQTEEARTQVTAEQEPTIRGLKEVSPGAVESVQTYLSSVGGAVDDVVQQGNTQLDAAGAGALREVDNLSQAAQGRGVALLAEGEARLDAALTGGLLAQANLTGQAGQLLDETGRDVIDQIAEAGTTGAPPAGSAGPGAIQRQDTDPGAPAGDPILQEAQDEAVGLLDQVEPSLDQAADNQTATLTQSLADSADGAGQAGSAWVNETQGNMSRLADMADTGLSQVVDGAASQLDSTVVQSETQAADEVDRISQDVAGNVDQVRQSVDAGVGEATDKLRGGVDEGAAHADETFSELPAEMDQAAEAQESFWGKVGHWVSEQLSQTWEAIKGMADWGFILDLAVGIVVGALVAVAVAALIGTGVGAILVAGALAGAAGFAAGQMSANVRHGDPLFKGVGHAAILGAFVGLGGAVATVASLGLLAGTGVVMLAAGLGTVTANLASGRKWDDHLLSTVLIVGVFHAVMKPVMERIPGRRGPTSDETPRTEGKGTESEGTEGEGTESEGTEATKTPSTIDMGKQGKHIPGHNNFISGRSELTHPDPQGLLDSHGGKGSPVSGTRGEPGFKERVDFGQEIGTYVDPATGARTPTTVGIIHYGKSGAHIVPARPISP